MKEFIDKLIERLAVENKKWLDIWDKQRYDQYADGMSDAFDEAIDIVNELAEEYKLFGNSEQVKDSKVSEMPTGWIPCSKQEEPTENGKYLVYVQHYSNKDLYDTCMVDWFGEWKVSYEWNVIAWQPIAPYTEGE